MRVERVICPACESEEKITSEADNMHEYSEGVTSRVCDRQKCKEWDNSPEQRLLRAMFGERK